MVKILTVLMISTSLWTRLFLRAYKVLAVISLQSFLQGIVRVDDCDNLSTLADVAELVSGDAGFLIFAITSCV